MQHRFHIPPQTLREVLPKGSSSDHPDSEISGRTTNLRGSGYLRPNPGGPLFNRIRILDQNAIRFTVVKADQWVDFGRNWFLRNNPYEEGVCDMDQEQINQEIENYFTAFVETCNHGEWEDGNPRWSANSKNKGLIQTQSHFQVLIKVFPAIWEKAVGPDVPTPMPVSAFRKAMEPLKWVDWLDPRLKDTFGGR